MARARRSPVFATAVALAGIALALSLVAPGASADPTTPSARPMPVRPGTARGPVSVGVAPPELEADRVSGPDPVALGQLSGRVVIVDFWATWCGPCLAMMPVLDALHAQHHDRGLTVLGISREPLSDIQAHVLSRPVGYTIARDRGPTSTRFGVRSVPTLVVVGRDGKVRDLFVGVDSSRVRHLVSLVSQLLDEPTP